MKKSRITVVIPLLVTLLLTALPANAWPGYVDGEFEQFGPWPDELIFMVYPSPEHAYDGLEAGEVDWTDCSMTKARKDKYLYEERTPGNPWSNYIGVADYYERGMYQFDLNTNETFTNTWDLPHLDPYVGKINPTHDLEFRKALNFLADKTRYVTEITQGMAGIMDTVLPPSPPYGPFEEYYYCYYDGPPFYYYDVTEAESILDAAGWDNYDGDGNLLPNERNVPAWVDPARPEISEYLGGGLVFVMRTDKPLWMGWSNLFADQLEAVGIPVLRDAKSMLAAIFQVMVCMSFHIYGGHRQYTSDPPSVFDWWYSDWYVGPGVINKNYVGYVDPVYDKWYNTLRFANSVAQAQQAAKECQQILKEDTPTIPLYYELGSKGYSRTVASGTHAGETLVGLVNEDGVGINSYWTKLNARAEISQGGTLVQGLCTDIESMNPISAMMQYDYEVLDVLFDSLIKQDPYSPGGSDHDIPWLADSWEETLYDATGIMDPALPGYPMATKITFHLDQNQPPVFSDGTPLTANDIDFTIFIQKKCGPDVGWRYPSFEIIDQTVVPDANTIEIYFNSQSIFFIHMIGFEYILPKHIWENCRDYGPNDYPEPKPPYGDDRLPTHPDWDPYEAVYFLDVFAEPQYLIGSGPYKFNSRLPGMWITTEKNPLYFHSKDAWNTWHATADIDLSKLPPGPQPANCYTVNGGELWYIIVYWDEYTTDHPVIPGDAPPEADVAQPRNYHIDLSDYGQIKAKYGDIW